MHVRADGLVVGPCHEAFVHEIPAQQRVVGVEELQREVHFFLLITTPRLELLGESLEHHQALGVLGGDLFET